MARKPRILLDNHLTLLMVQGCQAPLPESAGIALFWQPRDCQYYLNLLKRQMRVLDISLHAYSILPDRIYVLVTPIESNNIEHLMRVVNRQYAKFLRQTYNYWQKNQAIFANRYYASLVQADEFGLAVQAWIESLSQTASLHLSTYEHHTGISYHSGITSQRVYWDLANTPFERHQQYQVLLEESVYDEHFGDFFKKIRNNQAIGQTAYLHKLTDMTGIRFVERSRGRPIAQHNHYIS